MWIVFPNCSKHLIRIKTNMAPTCWIRCPWGVSKVVQRIIFVQRWSWDQKRLRTTALDLGCGNFLFMSCHCCSYCNPARGIWRIAGHCPWSSACCERPGDSRWNEFWGVGSAGQRFLTFTSTLNPDVVFQAFVEPRFCPMQKKMITDYWYEMNQQFIFNHTGLPRF